MFSLPEVSSRPAEAKLPLMAKIEKLESLDIIDEIIAVADSIMVARGDLGLEVRLRSAAYPEGTDRQSDPGCQTCDDTT